MTLVSHGRWHPDRLAERLPFLRRRARVAAGVRAFFDARGYLEVETPYAVTTPGEEVHLATFATEQVSPEGERRALRLHTSPEFAMKKLLAGGVGRCFQLARVWRNGEGSDLHSAEFTMLEWYRPGGTMDDLIDETFALLRAVLPPAFACRGIDCSLENFERLTVAEAFSRHVGADLLSTLEDAAALAGAGLTAYLKENTTLTFGVDYSSSGDGVNEGEDSFTGVIKVRVTF